MESEGVKYWLCILCMEWVKSWFHSVEGVKFMESKVLNIGYGVRRV